MDRELVQKYARNLLINKKWHNYLTRFDDAAIKKNFFPNATFELTAFCTLKCPMCFVRIDKKRAQELGGRPCTAKDWINLARQFRDQGGLFLLLTGGEAMMRPDFLDIYTEISKMGLLVSLFTNGTTVDNKMIEMLKKRPPAMVGMTIYGASEKTYERFGGTVGGFQKAVNGLDKLLTITNLAIDVRFVACKKNYKDLKAVYELVAKREKMISVDYGTCAPVRGANSDARKLRLSKRQMKEMGEILNKISEPVIDEYKRLVSESGDNEETDTTNNSSETTDERGWRCRGGKNSVYIAWDGRMYPCDMANYPFAFPLEQGFKEAASDIRRQIDSMLLPKRCLTCVNKDVTCTCIPKAQNEMKDCARAGEQCNYISRSGA